MALPWFKVTTALVHHPKLMLLEERLPLDPVGVVVRLWDHPLIVWIWIGGFTMALGGLVSLCDRSLRLGVAARAPRPAVVPPSSVPAPAE